MSPGCKYDFKYDNDNGIEKKKFSEENSTEMNYVVMKVLISYLSQVTFLIRR